MRVSSSVKTRLAKGGSEIDAVLVAGEDSFGQRVKWTLASLGGQLFRQTLAGMELMRFSSPMKTWLGKGRSEPGVSCSGEPWLAGTDLETSLAQVVFTPKRPPMIKSVDWMEKI